ncbi:hypothetical protein FKW77_009685 [Venturia effusa]|uniref:Heterokaryon incompatibility domain-containing protein n=1 Tax=Venturia effusa TaxID=50376 RepID=A0A517L069_9PEZI|nr:hypothetical protein FKW77_009685 [Venturia effusa]
MGEICSIASALHVWLGLASDSSDEAMSFIRSPREEALSPSIEQALHPLFKRAYWTRLWISISSAQIHDTYSKIGWDIDLPRIPFDLIASKDSIKDYVKYVGSRPRKDGSVDTRSSFEWLDIYHFFGHNCFNVLDKVYAIQSLIQPQHCVPVDYSISVDDLFFRLFPVFVSCTVGRTSDPPWTEASLSSWRHLVTLLRALGRAINVQFSPSIALNLVVTELRIIGVQVSTHPSPKLKIRPWKSPENPPDLPEFVRWL